MKTINVQQLNELKQTQAKITIIDVREQWEWDLCHIGDSIHLPLSAFNGKPDALSEDDTLVMVCHHGMRSLQAGQYLEQLGFTDVINLHGGVDAWAAEIDPQMERY